MVTEFDQILKKVDAVDPAAYARSRNYFNGAVTRLSPYLSRGVVDARMVLERVLQNGFTYRESISLIKELCWREYFQRVWQSKNIDEDIHQAQQGVNYSGVPAAVLNAETGIQAIDASVRELYETGYIHNHARMYIASLVCNVSGAHWFSPARWMYYHLLDGDWASNACSWQWVAGAFSNKKYYANQENINTYSGTNQVGTFLDVSYEGLPVIPAPEHLKKIETFNKSTTLPECSEFIIDMDRPVCIYNYYNLDPLWHSNEKLNRVLLLEPDIFSRYPVSQMCLNFMFRLSENIPDIRIFIGSFCEFRSRIPATLPVYFKEHPLNKHYAGIEEPRTWLVNSITGFYPSFSSYWRAIEPALEMNYNQSAGI